MRIVAALLLALALPSQADAECAAPRQRPKVLNDGADFARLVVATELVASGNDEGEALQPTWVWKAGKTSAKPVVTEPAPGLVVYALPDGVNAGQLFDGKTTRARVKRRTTKIPRPLEPPAVKTIQRTQTPLRRGTTDTHTVVTLAGAPAAEAVALIVSDEAGKARSFGLVDADTTTITVYSQRRCSVVPKGTVDSQAGEKVRVSYIDKLGRVGIPSEPITIVAAP